MFRRRKDQADSVPRSYPTASGHDAGPHDVWPDRGPQAAATHAHRYEQDLQDLRDSLASTGDPLAPYPAKVFAVQRPDGGAHTYVTWTEGVIGLLAPADVVLFVEGVNDPEPETTWVRWDVVAQVCADSCWQVEPTYEPIRILTTAWPSDEQLAELKARKLR